MTLNVPCLNQNTFGCLFFFNYVFAFTEVEHIYMYVEMQPQALVCTTGAFVNSIKRCFAFVFLTSLKNMFKLTLK